jgi:hypothetical protein
MITIELDSGGESAAAMSEAEAARSISRLLDQCEAENIRDVALRLPAMVPENIESMLRPLLRRPFRFSAWFRASPPAALAELFTAAGHRITIAATATPDGGTFRSLLLSPACAVGAPWQVSLFLALPTPPSGLVAGLRGVMPRAGTNLTLGLAWAGPDAGPSQISPPAEKEWTQVLSEMLAWWPTQGVTIHLACGLPLCLFSTEQLGELALTRLRFPLATCTPGLVVTLDGRARACPRLPAAGWEAKPAGVGLKALARQLIATSSCFAAFCNRPGEQSCRSLSTGACGGGCMAHNALIWRGAGAADALPPNPHRGANDAAVV